MRYSILLIALVLGGCNHQPTVPEKVLVPVAIPCQATTPPPPAYQFHTLTSADTIWDKVKVLLSDRQLSLAYELELEAALASCK